MRLVTAVTTLIQLIELFPAKKSALRNRIVVRAATSYRQRLVRVSRVGLAVDRRFLVYPDDRTFPVPVGHVSRGPRAAIGSHFASQVCPAGRQQPNARALT